MTAMVSSTEKISALLTCARSSPASRASSAASSQP